MTEARFRQLWDAGRIASRSVDELTELVNYMEDDLLRQPRAGRLILQNNIFKVRELIARKKLESEVKSDSMDA